MVARAALDEAGEPSAEDVKGLEYAPGTTHRQVPDIEQQCGPARGQLRGPLNLGGGATERPSSPDARIRTGRAGRPGVRCKTGVRPGEVLRVDARAIVGTTRLHRHELRARANCRTARTKNDGPIESREAGNGGWAS